MPRYKSIKDPLEFEAAGPRVHGIPQSSTEPLGRGIRRRCVSSQPPHAAISATSTDSLGSAPRLLSHSSMGSGAHDGASNVNLAAGDERHDSLMDSGMNARMESSDSDDSVGSARSPGRADAASILMRVAQDTGGNAQMSPGILTPVRQMLSVFWDNSEEKNRGGGASLTYNNCICEDKNCPQSIMTAQCDGSVCGFLSYGDQKVCVCGLSHRLPTNAERALAWLRILCPAADKDSVHDHDEKLRSRFKLDMVPEPGKQRPYKVLDIHWRDDQKTVGRDGHVRIKSGELPSLHPHLPERQLQARYGCFGMKPTSLGFVRDSSNVGKRLRFDENQGVDEGEEASNGSVMHKVRKMAIFLSQSLTGVRQMMLLQKKQHEREIDELVQKQEETERQLAAVQLENEVSLVVCAFHLQS